MAPKTARTCIVYCRVSTSHQRENETIGAQVTTCKRLIAQHGLTPLKYGENGDGWVIDDGVSGTLLEGRRFAKLIDDIKAGTIKPSALVVYSLSRISRVAKVGNNQAKIVQSHEDAGRIQGVLIATKTKVIDESGENDPASIGTGVKLILASEEYSDIRRRTMDGKARLYSDGAWAKGGLAPFGYQAVFRNGRDRKNGFTLAPHPDNEAHLRSIIGWYLEKGSTHAARMASEVGIRTGHGHAKWRAYSVLQIMANAKVYLGEATHVVGGEPRTIKYPAILDHATYSAIERRRKERTLKKRAVILSTGYVDCVCGAHVQNRLSDNWHYTRCSHACGSMREDRFSAYLWSAVVCRLVQMQRHERNHPESIDYAKREAAVRAKLDEVNARILRLVDAFTEGGLDKANYKERNGTLQDERVHHEGELAQIRAEHAAHLQRQATEADVETRIASTLDELAKGTPDLDRKRQVLADVLQGGRVLVKKWGSDKVWITLPALGSLPPFTLRTDRQIWDQMIGKPVAGRWTTTRSIRQGQAAAEKAYLAALASLGGTVTSRTTNDAGDTVVEVELPDE